jgi:hypothetical protein
MRIATPGFAASIAFDLAEILDGQALIVRRDGMASTIVKSVPRASHSTAANRQ